MVNEVPGHRRSRLRRGDVPMPELKDRGDLAYWAITSLGVGDDPQPFFDEATSLGAAVATVQPCDVDTPLADCIEVVRQIQEVAREYELHTGIETHRDTFTETPERTYDMYDGYECAEGQPLPLCFDHSHFAVPELGNANPAYGLSCFPDVWRDACVVGGDLRKAWNGV